MLPKQIQVGKQAAQDCCDAAVWPSAAQCVESVDHRLLRVDNKAAEVVTLACGRIEDDEGALWAAGRGCGVFIRDVNCHAGAVEVAGQVLQAANRRMRQSVHVSVLLGRAVHASVILVVQCMRQSYSYCYFEGSKEGHVSGASCTRLLSVAAYACCAQQVRQRVWNQKLD